MKPPAPIILFSCAAIPPPDKDTRLAAFAAATMPGDCGPPETGSVAEVGTEDNGAVSLLLRTLLLLLALLLVAVVAATAAAAGSGSLSR